MAYPKYPKLWDGPNPVGAAKVRALELTDAPYLTARGPGYVARKRGLFSEVRGKSETRDVPGVVRSGIGVLIEDVAFNPAASYTSAWSATGTLVGAEPGADYSGDVPLPYIVFSVRGDVPLGTDPLGTGTVKISRRLLYPGMHWDDNVVERGGKRQLLSYDRYAHRLVLCGRPLQKVLPPFPGAPLDVCALFSTGLDVPFRWHRTDLEGHVFVLAADFADYGSRTAYVLVGRIGPRGVKAWDVLATFAYNEETPGLLSIETNPSNGRKTYRWERSPRYVDGRSFVVEITEDPAAATGFTCSYAGSAPPVPTTPPANPLMFTAQVTQTVTSGTVADVEYRIGTKAATISATGTGSTAAVVDQWDGATVVASQTTPVTYQVDFTPSAVAQQTVEEDQAGGIVYMEVPQGQAPSYASGWTMSAPDGTYVAPEGYALIARRTYRTYGTPVLTETYMGVDYYEIPYTERSTSAYYRVTETVTSAASGGFGSATATYPPGPAPWPPIAASESVTIQQRGAVGDVGTAYAALRVTESRSTTMTAGGAGVAAWSAPQHSAALTVQFADGTTVPVAADIATLFDAAPAFSNGLGTSVATLDPDNFAHTLSTAFTPNVTYLNAIKGFDGDMSYVTGNPPPANWDAVAPYTFTHSYTGDAAYTLLSDWQSTSYGRDDESFMRKPDGSYYEGFFLHAGYTVKAHAYSPYDPVPQVPVQDFATYFIPDPRTGGFVLQVSWVGDDAAKNATKAHRLYVGNQFGITPLTPILNAWLSAQDPPHTPRDEQEIMIGFDQQDYFTLV